MPARSALTLLGILQRHGVTVAMLERWVVTLECRETGVFAFHQKEGTVKVYKLEMASGPAADRGPGPASENLPLTTKKTQS